MKRLIWGQGILFALLILLSSNAFSKEIQCYNTVPPQEYKDLSSKIDAYFGKAVNAIVPILFYEPFSAEVKDKQTGEVVKIFAAAKDESGKTHSIIQIKVEKDGISSFLNGAEPCLDQGGQFQLNEQAFLYLTQWRFENNQFTYDRPYTSDSLEAKGMKVLWDKDESSGQKTPIFQISQLEIEQSKTEGMPLIVVILLFGSLFYTLWYKFANFRFFKHAIDCVRGIYDNPKDPGEISHFQALTSALSATVGLGNIAGVAIAIALGGPGAIFWMMLLGFLGMSSKFHECTLGQVYRWIDHKHRVHGGPKYYLSRGLGELGQRGIGKLLAFIFAIFCIGGSLGGGNMFQANQAYIAIKAEVPEGLKAFLSDIPLGDSTVLWDKFDWFIGFLLAFLVGLVILGGIKRIGRVTSKLIPFMVVLYLGASLWIILKNFHAIPSVFQQIFQSAFDMSAGLGGFIGVAVQGIKRAVFSNEAGIGSASIAHSAAKTDEPIREGIVALLEPFIDTVVICFISAFILIITGAYQAEGAGQGVEMMRYAFSQEISWFPLILSISVFFFAYSTMISWSYYGEKAWTYLFGYSESAIISYKVLFLCFIVLGTVTQLDNVVTFTDLMILSMAFPNILGGIWLSKKVGKALNEYNSKLKTGKFKKFK